MPKVIITVDFSDEGGRQETLSECLCDWPDCPNIAQQVLGLARQLGMYAAVCEEHAAVLARKSSE